ncbi:Protein of unknown function [Rhizobiales bacterium GAS113]|nr:Protein of unknown function [Rhizobiales bacterium GAS113]
MPFDSIRGQCRRFSLAAACGGLIFTLFPPQASAQSFDCAKARSPIENAICGSADLKAQDAALAESYGRLLATQARGAELRDGQRQWLIQRDLSCAPFAADPVRLTACLASVYRTRLTFLASVAQQPPDILPPAPADPSASLSRETASAALDQDTILRVDTPGRLSIRAESATGVALQLVDMIAGPGDIEGEAGLRDGRLDVLVDKGTYKLRSFGAVRAQGSAHLTVQPFRAAAAANASLLRGGQFSGDLADLQQRSFWLIVDMSGRVFVEAAGRALHDLRLWRNGTDLAALNPSLVSIEPKPGHGLTRARLEGSVEPGLYLVTAYGGVSLPWADGESAQPFHIRAGAPDVMAGGFAEGVIGPLGSTRFEVPAPATYMRLELPEPAPARISVARGTASAQMAAIAKNSRQPVVAVVAPESGSAPAIVEVFGLEGQFFRLRALRPASSLRVNGAGPHLVAVDVVGEGGDELPATVVLARFDSTGKGSVLASSTPRVGPGLAWRDKFNLRGASSLIFEVSRAGPVGVSAQGPGVDFRLEPLLGGTAPRVDGKLPRRFDVEAGWYVLRIDPIKGAVGILDLTVGPPGLTPNLAPAAPPRISIPLGLQDFDKTSFYQVYANSGEGLVTAPRAPAVPIDLAGGPLTLLQPARGAGGANPAPVAPPAAPLAPGRPQPASPILPVAQLDASRPFEIPVRVPLDGRIIVTETNGVPVAATFTKELPGKTDRTLVVAVPVSDHDRTLVIAWTKAISPAPMPTVSQQMAEQLDATKPRFFELERDAHRGFRLEVQEGGLYRVETLGRLKTSATIGTAFLPKIRAAQDNGAGHNALLQTYLRAGSYKIDVAASDSNGHLGILASPAPLLDAGLLAPEESARATLAEGGGAIFGLDIPQAGKYRLDLYGLERKFTVRLEDAEGWPLAVPSPLSTLERSFAAGRYRLVVLPEAVDARVVARLRRIADPTVLDGHGPHPLVFDSVQKFQWREPQGKDAPRLPDRWEFSLQGPANVVLDVSDGMIADLVRTDADQRPIGKIAHERGYSGVLPAGHYALEARALGRNDRLDYTLTLRSKELQPGIARFVDLPAAIPFAVASDRVVSITTFGRTELRGVLRDADGRVIERLTGRANDWNIALSRRLAAGAYRLDLAAATAQVSTDASADSDDTDDAGRPQTRSGSDEPSGSSIEMRLALPDAAEAPALAFAGSAQLSEARVHQLALPQAETDSLVLVAAQSAAELVVSLERRDADGHWQSADFERGRAPVIAFPADGDAARPWRASVWAVDGGAPKITIAARNLRQPVQAMGTVTFAPFAIEGFAQPVRVAAVAVPGAGLVNVKERRPDLRQGSAPGRPLRPTEGGVLVPQSDRLWLVASATGAQSVTVEPVSQDAGEIALDLSNGETATVPKSSVPDGRIRLWRAVSTFGQPGLAAGHGMGVAAGSAIALSGDEVLRVWNAAGEDGLRLQLAALDLETRQPISVEATVSIAVPPRSAQPIRLRAGAKHVALDLAAGLGAFASGGGSHGLSVWAADVALSREADGDWTDILLVNTGDKEAAASLSQAPPTGIGGLAAGAVLKRFFGAGGSLALTIAAKPGDRLGVGGATATFISETGAVLRGTSFVLPGPGDLVLDHQAGLVAAWIGNDATSPWPAAAAAPIAAPQSVKLEGAAMRFALKQDTPVLLHARTSAPVILVLKQGDAAGEPVLFPAGAEFHRYVAAGEAELSLYSPHEGSLGGTLELTATPVLQMAEGVGEPQALAPGATALFGFEVTRAGNIGLGIRAEPDRAEARLLDAAGKSLGEGVAQLRRLEPGRYFLEARAPVDGGTLSVRPVIIGLAPPPAGPPPEVVKDYLEMVGLTSRAR